MNKTLLVILFFCISIIIVGTSCSESTELRSHLSDDGRAALSDQDFGGIYDSESIALWMIEKRLGEIVELMKEEKQPCSSN